MQQFLSAREESWDRMANTRRCGCCEWFNPVIDRCKIYGPVRVHDKACESYMPADL